MTDLEIIGEALALARGLVRDRRPDAPELADSWFGPADAGLSRLTARLAELEAASAWNFDMEAAPRDGSKFDAWQRDRRIIDVYWSDIQEGWCIDGSYGPQEPTMLAVFPPVRAWRPLPAPPEREG